MIIGEYELDVRKAYDRWDYLFRDDTELSADEIDFVEDKIVEYISSLGNRFYYYNLFEGRFKVI